MNNNGFEVDQDGFAKCVRCSKKALFGLVADGVTSCICHDCGHCNECGCWAWLDDFIKKEAENGNKS